jgi:hypothetical protein
VSGVRDKNIVYGGSRFVAVGDSGVSVSTDGKDWVRKSMAGRKLLSVTYGAGKFVAVGDSGAVFTSTDGETWADHSITVRNVTLMSVVFGKDLFITVGIKTTSGSVLGVYTSSDGQTWIEKASGIDIFGWTATSYPTTICFGNNKFVAAGNNTGTLKESSNGIDWSNLTLPGTANSYRIESVVYSEDRFVALGVQGGVNQINATQPTIVLSSTDGTNWTALPTLSPAGVKYATFAKGSYVLAADSGNVYASANGQNWVRQQKATNRNLQTIYFGNDIILAAGIGGAMLYSSEPPNPISVRHAASRPASKNYGMSIKNSQKAATVTLSFTPDKPGIIAVYSLTGKQIYKKHVNTGERTIYLPSRIISNRSVIVKYTGGDGKSVARRFQTVK